MTTTPVVPSPISWSWLFESSTRSLPIWFSTSICSRIVAPSFAAKSDRQLITPDIKLRQQQSTEVMGTHLCIHHHLRSVASYPCPLAPGMTAAFWRSSWQPVYLLSELRSP